MCVVRGFEYATEAVNTKQVVVVHTSSYPGEPPIVRDDACCRLENNAYPSRKDAGNGKAHRRTDRQRDRDMQAWKACHVSESI